VTVSFSRRALLQGVGSFLETYGTVMEVGFRVNVRQNFKESITSAGDSVFNCHAERVRREHSHVVVFWVVTSCSKAVKYQRFEGPCCLYLQN